jgi:hypothetical protein
LSKPQFSEFKAEGRRQEAEGKIRIFFPSALCPLPPAFFEMWLTELAIAVILAPFSQLGRRVGDEGEHEELHVNKSTNLSFTLLYPGA